MGRHVKHQTSCDNWGVTNSTRWGIGTEVGDGLPPRGQSVDTAAEQVPARRIKCP